MDIENSLASGYVPDRVARMHREHDFLTVSRYPKSEQFKPELEANPKRIYC
jgi:hypothetical protein